MAISDLLSSIDSEIARLQQARSLLAGVSTGTRGGYTAESRPVKAKRTLSAAAREKIAAAQRKRWAAQKKAAKKEA
jgi:hypothetical protein